MASNRASVKTFFRLPGFYPNSGPFFPSLTQDETSQLVFNIVGDVELYKSTQDLQAAVGQFTLQLLKVANSLRDTFIALRGHIAFFDTLATLVDSQAAGEVSGKELAVILEALSLARLNYDPTRSHSLEVDTETSREADQWLLARQHVQSLPPLPTSTVTVQHAGTSIADITGVFSGAAFDLGAANEIWPPLYFNSYQRSYILDPSIRQQLVGVTPSARHPEKQPALPNMASPPIAAKLYLTFAALAHQTPAKAWSLFMLPVGPFRDGNERALWKNTTGHLSRVCATWGDFEKHAAGSFAAGQNSVIGLLTPWIGTPQQVASAGRTTQQQGEMWTARSPRQGIVIVLHRVMVNDVEKFIYITYDPTMDCPRIRQHPVTKASLMIHIRFRSQISEAIDHFTKRRVIHGWVGGRHTRLLGSPDSVEMSCDFIQQIVTSPNDNPFDLGPEDWTAHGFTAMARYQ